MKAVFIIIGIVMMFILIIFAIDSRNFTSNEVPSKVATVRAESPTGTVFTVRVDTTLYKTGDKIIYNLTQGRIIDRSINSNHDEYLTLTLNF